MPAAHPPAAPPSAYLFDLDDTLVHSAPTWQWAETAFLRQLGHDWTPELATQYKGMNALDVGRTIHRLLQPPGVDAETCAARLRTLLIDRAALVPPEPLPGAGALLAMLARRRRESGGAPLAVASGSPLELIESVLRDCGWRAYFDLLISSESVPRGKPEPDVFLAAAAALGVAPADCMVFEDSLHGVRAGVAAGMVVVAIPSRDDPRIAATATHSFENLHDVANWRTLASS